MFERVEIMAQPRTWPTVLSFLFESAGVLLLLAIPLLYPAALPSLRLEPPPVPITAPRMPEHVDIISSEHVGRAVSLLDRALHYPGRIPPTIDKSADAPAPVDPFAVSIPGYSANSDSQAIANVLIGSANLGTKPAPAPPPAPARPAMMHVSHLDAGMLIKRVQPEYPAIARMQRIEGTVVLTAVIDEQGEISRLQVVGGNAIFVQSAMAAVRQWRYRPYILNGSPIPVETQITVKFALR